ncbi:MAG: Nre family DNA repair protein [Candidatus Bathyarchaeia archaeon]
MPHIRELLQQRRIFSEEEFKGFEFLEGIEFIQPKVSICLLCKGGRMLCGKPFCPIAAKAKALAKLTPLIASEHIEGSSPPSVFVGHVGYPKVAFGPMMPPYFGDTEILDTPERWIGLSISEIIDYRFSLIRGKIRASVDDASKGGRILDKLQELAMGISPTEAEATFAKTPRRVLTLDDNSQPFGPSAPLRFFNVPNIKTDWRVEKVFSDGDLRASEAVVQLYKEGVAVTRIQRPFSLGMLGLRSSRKLVPTRWSITAIDSILSLHLIKEIKQYETINEYRVYTYTNLDNRFVVFLMPYTWRFEWIEAWFPGTTWNANGAAPAIMGDWEDWGGRRTYASVGGCYYSARLATAEKLSVERRQAAALLLREIHPGYVLPVGVWNVRESVRRALRAAPEKFDSLEAALAHATRHLAIPLKTWIANSTVLRQLLLQTRITEFLAPS